MGSHGSGNVGNSGHLSHLAPWATQSTTGLDSPPPSYVSVDTFERKPDATPALCESAFAAALKAKTKKILDEKAVGDERRRAHAALVAALAPVRATFMQRLECIAGTAEALQLRAYLKALSEDSTETIGLKFDDDRYMYDMQFIMWSVPPIYFSKDGFCVVSGWDPKLMSITKMQDSGILRHFSADKPRYYVQLADDCENWLQRAIQKAASSDFAPVPGVRGSDYEWFAM
jgi:hypothetical protein